MTDPAALFADLAAEGAELDALVADLDEHDWRTPTPAPGWSIAHQIGHLAWTDGAAVLAATDRDAFAEQLQKSIGQLDTFVDTAASEGAARARADLLADWRTGRQTLIQTLHQVPVGAKLPWFGPPMSATSMATARLMETWAHGQDIADALGVSRPATARLRHIAHIGVRTVGFAFAVHDLPAPEESFRVELAGPDGDVWVWGPPDGANLVRGPALDFCLLVTQRRHSDDLSVDVSGAQASQWLPIAQAFAGPPGEGRKAGQFQ